MFLGHYAAALAAKRVAPGASLGTLVLSAQLVDLLWPLMLLAGVEQVRIDPGNTVVTPLDFTHYPVTHSLAGVTGWALLTGGVLFALRRSRTTALVAAALVLSHWLLDFLSHRPDLPIGFSGETKVGLGLWNSFGGTLLVEIALFAGGAAVYLKATRAIDRTGTMALWGLLGILALIYALNILGPPPPGEGVIAAAGNLTWLFVLWAWWADRHRAPGPDAGLATAAE